MKAVITLDYNSPAKVQIEKNGTQRTLHLNMQDLADYIVSSVKEESAEPAPPKAEVVMASPSLPPNTIKYARLSDGTDLLFIFHPETKATVTYHKTVFEHVPFPNLVFCFGVRNNQLIKKSVMAYKDRFLRDTTELYRFPYSNVYNGGSMCYFDNHPIQDLVQLQTLPHIWMNGSFNDHLYNQETNNKLNKPLREIFTSSQNKEFDYDMLKPMNSLFFRWAEGLLN